MHAGFERILSLTVEHGFFYDGLARGLTLQPDPATEKRLRATWLGLLRHDHGLAVAANRAAWESVEGALEPFRFLAWIVDPLLWQVCDRRLIADGRLCRFTTERGVAEADGRLRLHAGKTAGPKDLRKAQPDALPHPLVPARRPLFECLLTPQPGEGSIDCVVRFAAPTAFWTYHLQSAELPPSLSVVNADDGKDFRPMETEQAGRRSFRSRQPLPVLQRSPLRFQVRERHNGVDRLLVRRLPSAAPQFDLIPGRADRAVESQIFVNL